MLGSLIYYQVNWPSVHDKALHPAGTGGQGFEYNSLPKRESGHRRKRSARRSRAWRACQRKRRQKRWRKCDAQKTRNALCFEPTLEQPRLFRSSASFAASVQRSPGVESAPCCSALCVYVNASVFEHPCGRCKLGTCADLLPMARRARTLTRTHARAHATPFLAPGARSTLAPPFMLAARSPSCRAPQ
jgi:hypothetical protein